MSDMQAAADRVEIEALRGEFADAAMMHDYDRFASLFHYSLYHDRYQRTPDGWKFTERVYEIRYADHSPLAGSVPGPAEPPADPPGGNTPAAQGASGRHQKPPVSADNLCHQPVFVDDATYAAGRRTRK